MRKAIRVGGRLLIPSDCTDEEFEYALSLQTAEERERLSKTLTRQLRWMVWRIKHPRLAGLLDAVAQAGHAL